MTSQISKVFTLFLSIYIEISIDLVKAFPDKLSKPLSHVYNTATRSGSFLKCWKKGYITRIQKKGVSLDFMESKTILELIDEQQFGNVKGLSMKHYLVGLLDAVYKLLDEPYTWLNLLLIDLQKAFELVSNILVVKLLNEFKAPIF